MTGRARANLAFSPWGTLRRGDFRVLSFQNTHHSKEVAPSSSEKAVFFWGIPPLCHRACTFKIEVQKSITTYFSSISFAISVKTSILATRLSALHQNFFLGKSSLLFATLQHYTTYLAAKCSFLLLSLFQRPEAESFCSLYIVRASPKTINSH